MISLPAFTTQSMYDAETDFCLQMSSERLAKFIVHYEALKSTQGIPGAIVECGVFKGTSLVRFAKMRDLVGGPLSRSLIAFDSFGDEYPTTTFVGDLDQREHWISSAGASSISVAQLESVFSRFKIENYKLIPGDATQSIQAFAQENKGMKISLLNIDIDFVEPTYAALSALYDLVVPGGMILLDNYGGEGTSGISYHGDTFGVDKFFSDRGIVPKIETFSFVARPCFIRKT